MLLRPLLALSLAALILSSAVVARAAEPQPQPQPQLQPPPRPNADLPPAGARVTHIVAGTAVTLGSYGLAFGSSYLFSDARGAKDLRIPIAGPWLALAKTGCPEGDPNCSVVPLVLGAILEVIGGVTQVGGLAIIGEGLFLNTSSARPAPKAASLTLRAMPMDFGAGSAGLGVVGSF